MVEWRPLIGALPPLSEAEWQRVFALYRQTSEYTLANAGMTLEEFRAIFWWEYIHRLFGRLIGLVYAAPLAFFLFRGWVRKPLIGRLLFFLLLGGSQGVLGWIMVRSGFVDRTDVSQYRLVAHLGLALLILGFMFWTALGLAWAKGGAATANRGATAFLATVVLAVLLTIVSGGFVAGLNGGLLYNEFPFMGDSLIPEDYWGLGPAAINAFENPSAAQFHHRVLAVATAAWSLFVCWRIWRIEATRLRITLLAIALSAQVALGIATLLTQAALPLAALHQAIAVLVFLLALVALDGARRDPS